MLRHADSLLSDGPYHEKDLDLLVRGTDVKTACRVLSETGFTRFGRSPTRYHLDYARYVEGTIVAVDIHAGAVSWNGIPYAPGNRLLERRLDDRSLPVPALADEAALLAMHCILDKRLFSAPYRARIETLLPAAGPSTVEQALLEWIGCSTANHLISALVGQHYGRAVGLRHDILLDIGIMKPKYWLPILRSALSWRCRKLLPRKRGLLVAIVGPHGVGKSTTTGCLIERFKSSGWRLARFYMGRWREHILPLPQVARTHGISTQAGPQDVSVSADTMRVDGRRTYRMARDLLYVLDLLLRYIVRLRPATRSHDLVLTDRYAYDLLFDLSITPIARFCITLLYPRADLCFFLYNDPEVLKARRDEHTLEEIQRQLDVYAQCTDTLALIPIHARAEAETVDALEARIRLERARRA